MEDFLRGGEQHMKKFVVGFLFDPTLTHVLMIRKQRPDWMKGFLNGIGGHVEAGETFDEAMKREFYEETGVMPDALNPFMLLHRLDNGEIERDLMCFWTIGEPFLASSVTDEPVEVFDVTSLSTRNDVVQDTRWVMLMAHEAAILHAHHQAFYEVSDRGTGGLWNTLQ